MLNIVIAVFEIIWVVLFVGFWVIFFIEDNESKMSEVEYKHEMSFPYPDLGWVTPNLLISAIGLLMEQNWGYLFSVIAGSGMMFLGIIDLAFNVQNKKFDREKYGFDAILSIGIVVLSLTFGVIFIIYGGFNLLG